MHCKSHVIFSRIYSSKTESSIRVVRVKLNDGERVVGVRYPQILISEVEETLREQNALEAVQLQVYRDRSRF